MTVLARGLIIVLSMYGGCGLGAGSDSAPCLGTTVVGDAVKLDLLVQSGGVGGSQRVEIRGDGSGHRTRAGGIAFSGTTTTQRDTFAFAQEEFFSLVSVLLGEGFFYLDTEYFVGYYLESQGGGRVSLQRVAAGGGAVSKITLTIGGCTKTVAYVSMVGVAPPAVLEIEKRIMSFVERSVRATGE